MRSLSDLTQREKDKIVFLRGYNPKEWSYELLSQKFQMPVEDVKECLGESVQLPAEVIEDDDE